MVYFFDYKIICISIVVYFAVVGIMLLRKKKDASFYLFFTFMYIYVNIAIKYTQFPIYNDPFQKSIMGAYSFQNNINVIPFKDSMNVSSILNIIMTIPFGFLLPFVLSQNIKKVIFSGVLFSLIIETTQLVIGLSVGYTSRLTDINDIICNTAGALVGYIIFRMFLKLTRILFRNENDKRKLVTYILSRL